MRSTTSSKSKSSDTPMCTDLPKKRISSDHLAQVQAEEQSSVEYKDVKDTQLQDARDYATLLRMAYRRART